MMNRMESSGELAEGVHFRWTGRPQTSLAKGRRSRRTFAVAEERRKLRKFMQKFASLAGRPASRKRAKKWQAH